MTLRKPIVLIEGELSELPLGDTITGSTGGGGGTGASNIAVCLTDGSSIANLPTNSGFLPVCLADGTTSFNIPLV